MTNIDKADILQAELQQLLPMKPEDKQRLDKKFRLEFNYNSNHIEGNTLTYGETELLLIFDDTRGNHSMREYEEMKAHDIAWQFVADWAADNERPLTEMHIKQLNEIILVRPFYKDAITADGQPTRRLIKVGDYKEHPNSVRLQNGEIFHCSSPIDTPIAMKELLEWYRDEENSLHPVTLAAMLHYRFVRIHPFDDGNGRISRLLMNYVLLKNSFPPVVIKSSDKSNYLKALHLADVGDFEPFIDYVAEQAVWSLELSIKAARGESVEEADDFAKQIKLLERKVLDTSPTKSPKLVYEVYEAVVARVVKRYGEILNQLERLFSDSRTLRYVNNLPEILQAKTTSRAKRVPIRARPNRVASVTPITYKVLGHDVYNDDIRSIEWRTTKYGLKGISTRFDLETILKVGFNINTYVISILVSNEIVYNVEKSYNDVSLTIEADEIGTKFGQYLATLLEDRIETGG